MNRAAGHVAPLVGAWIEINTLPPLPFAIPSLPSWERGLKYHEVEQSGEFDRVAPLVGAWIEIKIISYITAIHNVAPLVGAWIEITKEWRKGEPKRSLPSWERGLK